MSQAGSAKTESFNIGTATVMIGPMAEVMDLTPEKHSIGLVKNFTFSANDTYTELTQGVTNEIVYSVKTGSEITATMEVYEYTPRNLAYALGLDGYNITEGASQELKEAITGGSSTKEIKISASETSSPLDFQVGDYIIIQGNKSGEEDLVCVNKIEEVEFNEGTTPQIAVGASVHDFLIAAQKQKEGLVTITEGKLVVSGSGEATFSEPMKTAFGLTDGPLPVTGSKAISASNKLSTLGVANDNVLTITVAEEKQLDLTAKTTPVIDPSANFTITLKKAIPEGMSFGIGDRVKKANLIPVGSRESQPMLGAKVVGILPEEKKPITIIFPKIRVTNGFNIAFQSDQFGNMPYEFTPYAQVEKDPLYAEHKNDGFAFLLD